VFDGARVADASRHGPVILVRTDVTTDDIAGFASAAGVLTSTGGRTAHAAVIARQLNKVCVVGCETLQIDAESRTCRFGGRPFTEGDVLTVDGGTGRVYAGTVPVVVERPVEEIALVRSWSADAAPVSSLTGA
jgi:pyruvate,orthophosphate dikinase